MPFWKVRRHWAFKTGIAVAVLATVGVYLFPKLGTLTFDEVRKLVPQKSQGTFKPYSPADLKKRRLKIVDFQFDAAENRQFAVDPRLEPGFKDRIVSHDYLPTGELVEWDYTSEVMSKNGDNIVLERRGHGRKPRQEWIEFKVRYECTAQATRLSSGVVQKTLTCAQTDTSDPWKDLRVEYKTCRVEPLSPRARKAEAQYGEQKIKSGSRFVLATKETVTVEGDVICEGKRLGLGQESIVTIYTNEQPSLLNPQVGTRKELFSMRTVKTQTGRVVSFSKDEVTGTDRTDAPIKQTNMGQPNMEKPFKKHLARK